MSTPLHTVKDKFGSKEALVDKLVPLLDRREDESDAEFKERLLRVSNRKLLRLLDRVEAVRDRFGSREKLVDSIVELKGAKGQNADDQRRVLSGQGTGRLLSAHWGLSRAARRAQ